MPSVFIILLAIALGTTYLYLNTSEEITCLVTFSILPLSFILALIAAPCSIQLVILVLVLFSGKKITPPSNFSS